MSRPQRRRLTRRASPRVMALEARLMFDGAAAVEAVQRQADADADPGARVIPDTPRETARDTALEAMPGQGVASLPPALPGRAELVVIDARVPDLEGLLAALGPGRQVLVLDPSRDGLAQLQEALAGQPPLEALHLLGHGAQGQIALGATTLGLDQLDPAAPALQALGGLLSEQGDLLLYGCDVAEGANGQAFITRLAELTGADVAASTDATGANARGGDWVLEARAGQVETETLQVSDAAWAQSLPAPSVSLNTGYQLFDNGSPGGFGANSTNPDIDPNTANGSVNGVNAASSGSFTFTASANSTASDGSFQIDTQGNDVTGTLTFTGSLKNTAGTTVTGTFTLTGAISKHIKTIDGNSGDSEAFYFFTAGNGTANLNGLGFLLVVPGDEGFFSPTDTNISLPADNSYLAGLNGFRTLQQSSPTVSVSDVTVSEDSPYAVFTVSLSAASSTAVSFTPSLVSLGSGCGYATVGTDTGSTLEYFNGTTWVSASGGITLTAGSTSVLVRAAIQNDGLSEGPEVYGLSTGTVTGTVSNPAGAQGTGTISDDGTVDDVFLANNNTATATHGGADNDTPTVLDANWQTLNFNGTGTSGAGNNFLNLVGDGRANGDVVRFNNVITLNGQAVDAVVTTTLNNVSIGTYDSTANPSGTSAYFQPNLTATAAGGYASYRIDFYKAGTYSGGGTGEAVTLEHVAINSYDIDGVSSSNSDRQFQEFKGFSRYEVASNTQLTASTQADGSVRFTYAPTGSATNNTSIFADGYRVKVFYDSMNSLVLKAGVNASGAGSFNGLAYFAFDFSVGPGWSATPTSVDTPAASLSYDRLAFSEAGANNGSISQTATITLANETFTGTDGQTLSGVVVANLPDGLTAVVTRVDATHATLSFTGQATSHLSADDLANIQVRFTGSAFTGGNACVVTGAVRAGLSIDFADPAANTAPTASNVSASGNEDAASITITLSGSDADGTIASYTVSTLPSHGTLYSDAGLTQVVAAGDSVNAATLYFVPDADWNGSTSFSYTATDNSGATSTSATASLTVNAVNDAPEGGDVTDPDWDATDGRYELTTDEDTPVGGTVAAGDADGDTLAFGVDTHPSNGSVTIDAATGIYTYTPDAGWSGVDSFIVLVDDGNG
ncbi:DUF4347 domain-containing protein, partial [Ideonella livida]